ncbi:tetratricopeptide repeat protein [Tsuneonella amylolytica]|uniref:tetratricopeptide repeat protein n=1 Tax=Tsuneonella amylolytica TaxID=2338327 RepID=UPI0013C4367A|nr:tetratricopeptide repeat protein [Tsuneonella amylolytica]
MLLLPALLILAACGGVGGGDREGHAGDWRAMLRAGDGVGAEVALRSELAAGGDRRRFAPYLGEAELLQGDTAAAVGWLAPADFAPDVAAHGYHMLGRLRMQQGDFPAAGRAFDRALGEKGDQPDLWVDIGRLRWRGGEQVQAIEASTRALELGPDDPAALLFRAQLVRDARGNAAALPLLQRGFQAAPRDPGLLGEYAATLGELGRNSEMLEVVRVLAEVNPLHPKVLWLQAVLAARAGDADLARSLLQRGGDLDREIPAAKLLLALIDMDNGNYESAAQGLDRLLRTQPDNTRIAMLLGRALMLGGNNRELVARFADRADAPYFAMLVGRAHEALGDRAKAARYLDRARTSGAMTLRVVPSGTAADGAAAGGRFDGATVVREVRASLTQGRSDDARRKAQAFLNRVPGSSDAAALAGDAAFEAGDARGALALYRQAASVRKLWTLTKRMAAAYDRSGRPAEATALIASHLEGEPLNADAAVVLARRLVDRGELARARTLAARARTLGRNDPLLDGLE